MQKTFKELCELFENIESISSRLDMTALMGDFLKQCTVEEIQMISYLVQGRVAPMFVMAEFNYSEKSLLNLIGEYLKNAGKKTDFKKLRQTTGDIGDAVYEISQELKGKSDSKTILDVY